MKFTYCILILFMLLSCSHNRTENERIYIIQYKMPNDTIGSDSLPIEYFKEFYLDYNIILFDSMPEIYYHKKRFFCLPGMEQENKALPYFRNLKPDYFLNINNLNEIKETILADTVRPKWIYLAYNKDTIRDKRYFELKTFFTNNNINVSTRKITEEEEVILTSIMNGKKYEPHLIDWKNTSNVPNFRDEMRLFNLENKRRL